MSSVTTKAGIYKFTHLTNGKVYIGQAQNIRKRHCEHKRLVSNSLFGRALKKHGLASFFFEVLELVVDIAQLDSREQYWMDVYQCYHKQYGYNACPVAGSTRGIKHSEETRAKLRAAHQKNPCTGKKHSMFGKKHSEETRAKMSIAQIARRIDRERNPMFGKKHSEETRAKLSVARARINAERPRKSIIQYSLATSEVLRVWGCVGEIKEVLGICVTRIVAMCRGYQIHDRGSRKHVESVAGCGWRYV